MLCHREALARLHPAIRRGETDRQTDEFGSYPALAKTVATRASDPLLGGLQERDVSRADPERIRHAYSFPTELIGVRVSERVVGSFSA